MLTPSIRQFSVLGILSLLSACTPTTPTGQLIERELTRQTEDAVRSAAGPWMGLNPSITIRFSLTEAPNGQLQGTGRMREPNVEGDVPITVSGTYNRPNLSLTFAGMVFDGHDVSGTFGPEVYNSFAGVSGTLTLTGQNYARSLSLLLQEEIP